MWTRRSSRGRALIKISSAKAPTGPLMQTLSISTLRALPPIKARDLILEV